MKQFTVISLVLFTFIVAYYINEIILLVILNRVMFPKKPVSKYTLCNWVYIAITQF